MKKRILFLSNIHLDGVFAGNRVRIVRILDDLVRSGCEVCYCLLAPNAPAEETLYRTLGVSFRYVPHAPRPSTAQKLNSIAGRVPGNLYRFNHGVDDSFSRTTFRTLCELGQALQPDAVVAEYIFLSWTLAAFPRAKKVIDTHDIFADRRKLFWAVGEAPTFLHTSRRAERLALGRADIVLSITEEDTEYFRGIAEKRAVFTLKPSLRPQSLRPHSGVRRPLTIGMIGSANGVNRIAIGEWQKELSAMPLDLKQNVKWVIAGEMGRYWKGSSPEVVVLGRVESLEAFYSSIDYSLNPIKRGTGIKLKTTEAVEFAVPVLSYPEGLKGLPSARFLVSVENLNDAVGRARAGEGKVDRQEFATYVQDWNKGIDDTLQSIIEEFGRP